MFWQDFEFGSVVGNNFRKSSILDVWEGFEFAFVAINDFRRKIHLDVLQGTAKCASARSSRLQMFSK